MSNSETVILSAHLCMLKGLLKKTYLPKTISKHKPTLAVNVQKTCPTKAELKYLIILPFQNATMAYIH